MAKVAVPIMWLEWGSNSAFSNEVQEVFQAEGVWNPFEDFTCTGRVSINPDNPDASAKKLRIREKMEKILGSEEAARLFQLLEENHWDVSFFVDTW